jgi:hypothetical protein
MIATSYGLSGRVYYQLVALYFPGGRPWQFGQENHLDRAHVSGEVRFRMADQVVAGESRLGFISHNECAWIEQSPHLAGNDSALIHCRVLPQARFHMGRCDPLSCGAEEIVRASDVAKLSA